MKSFEEIHGQFWYKFVENSCGNFLKKFIDDF